MYDFKTSINAREYEAKDKYPTIFGTFDSLGAGEVMELINDHGPRPLHYQFIMKMPEQFEWKYLK